ncbi:CaiB/BaiF CoA transferase family protein [Paraburkholderia sp. B3]|uniref:CaiB/BaiF CoA transferase family protein n=1 Tax=Paraburkholderia sp. B3 TaxID=3134791 RepID=UPI003982BCE5
MSQPLSELKVLDLSRFIAGPHCASVLGDLGADVVKVERPRQGDDSRALEPNIEGESVYFLMFNRNKRGITLDFRNPAAQDLLRRLACEADVLIENFRPGTMEKMGCGWDDLHALNPRLVMARISGYGQSGPRAGEPCFDGIAQANSGLMDLTGSPDGPPTMAGTFVVDYSTALYACVGILAAIEERRRTGEGQLVDASLMGAATSLLMTAIPEYVVKGTLLTRTGNRDRYTAPSNTFRAADGKWVHVIAGGEPMFKRFAALIGRPDLLGDSRFSTLAARRANVEAVEAIAAEWVASLPAEEAARRLNAAELPAARVASIADIVADPLMREAAYIVDVEHPKAGPVPMHGQAVRVGDHPPAFAPPPLLGQHVDEVLSGWLGLSPDEISALREAGVV